MIKEFFNFRRKKEKPTWKEKFEEVYNYYKKIKNKPSKEYHFFSVSINNGFHVALDKIHLDFSTMKRGKTVPKHVTDFEEYDLNSDSDNGQYLVSDSEWNLYLKKAEEMSNFLDEKSEVDVKMSSSTVGDSGVDVKLNMEMRLDKLSYDLMDTLSDKFNKDYEFEVKYYLWSAESKNEKIIERIKFNITELKIGYGNRFYAQLMTKGKLGEDCSLWLEAQKYKYIDLEEVKIPERDEIIRVDVITEELSRKDKRNEKLPPILWYDATPSKYNSIEFINEISELLVMFNEQIKNK